MSNDYIVFHTTEAGSPAAYLIEYGRHGWVFEPANFEGSLYSMVYNTKEEAEAAAKSIFCLQKIDE